MPLYELVTIVRSQMANAQLADLVRKSVYIVLDNHGVVRRIENLGVQQLPFTMRAHMAKFDAGRTILLRFDARPALAAELSRQLRNDDRVIRHTVFRRPKGEQLGVIKNDGISPLDAVMNSGSLMGTLGDLNTLLEPQSGATSRSSGARPADGAGGPPRRPWSQPAAVAAKPPAAALRPAPGSVDSLMSLTALLNKRPGTAEPVSPEPTTSTGSKP